MLTADFDRLEIADGSRVLDMGCGGGRHAFEAWRRGATVVALDYSEGELKEVRGVLGAMLDAGELPHGECGGAVNGDALAAAVPRRRVRRHHRVRGARAPLGRHRRDRRARARVEARWPHGRHRADPLAGARVLGARSTITTTHPAGTCASTASTSWKRSSKPPGAGCAARITRTPCTRRTGG